MHLAIAFSTFPLPDSWLWVSTMVGKKQKPHHSISISTFYFQTLLHIACKLKHSNNQSVIISFESFKRLPCCTSLCCSPAVACRSAERQLWAVLTSEISWRAEWVVCSEFGLVRLGYFWLRSRSLLNKMSVFDYGARFNLFCDPDGSFFLFSLLSLRFGSLRFC